MNKYLIKHCLHYFGFDTDARPGGFAETLEERLNNLVGPKELCTMLSPVY